MATTLSNGTSGTPDVAVLIQELHDNIHKCVQNLHQIKAHDESMQELEKQREHFISETESKNAEEDAEIAAKRAAEDEARRLQREEKTNTFHDLLDSEMGRLEDDIANKLNGEHVDLQNLLEQRKVCISCLVGLFCLTLQGYQRSDRWCSEDAIVIPDYTDPQTRGTQGTLKCW
jgi:chromosome segregation ATPase